MQAPVRAPVYRYECEVTPDGEFRRLSSGHDFIHLLGFEEAELVAPDAWKKAIDPRDQAAADAIVERLTSGEPWSGRFRVKTKYGSTLVLDFHNEIETMPDGRLLIHGTARDVTGQVELETRLRERETRLRLLSESLPVVLWSTDRDLRFTWSSGSGLAALGLRDNEVEGITLNEFFEVGDSDNEAIAAHREALAGRSATYDFAWKGRRYKCSVEPLWDEVGVVAGAIGVAVDVTQSHRAEQEAHAVGHDVARLTVAADGRAEDVHAHRVIDLRSLVIDVSAHRVTKHGRDIDLTPIEFRLLVELASHPGELLERKQLLRSVWGHDFAGGDSPLWMTVKRLRDKIEDDPHHPVLIETVRGLGYRFTAA